MAETNAVFMKLPLFWADGAKIWFAHAESQFVIRNITAEITKYYNLLVALQNDVAITLRRLPANVRGYLHTYEDPRALAQQADLVWSSHHSQTIHQISKDDINLSTEELACNSVNHPSKKKEYSERSLYENYNSSSTSRWCFYPQKYGKKARNCTDPCSYSSSLGTGRTGGRR